VDEVDRVGTGDIAVLLSLMETVVVSETKCGSRREIRLGTKVFAASNSTNMPHEPLCQFTVLYFRPYQEAELLAVAAAVMTRRENVEPYLAGYVAGKVWQLSRSRLADPREAVRIGRLAKTREETGRILEVMGRYPVPRPPGREQLPGVTGVRGTGGIIHGPLLAMLS